MNGKDSFNLEKLLFWRPVTKAHSLSVANHYVTDLFLVFTDSRSVAVLSALSLFSRPQMALRSNSWTALHFFLFLLLLFFLLIFLSQKVLQQT